MKRSLIWSVLLGTALLMLSFGAFASGVLVYEQGSKASAQAGAWVARSDDATALAYNPAGIAFLKGMNVCFNLTYINADVKYESPTLGNWKDNKQNMFVPSAFFTWAIRDNVSFGFSVTAPYDLATDWNEHFPGRWFSRKSQITTIDYHPVVAFKVGENSALSFGLDYYDSQIILTRNQDTTALSTIYNGVVGGNFYFPGVPAYSSSEAFVATDMRDKALGFDIGWLIKNDPWSFGLTYRSKATFDYTGHTWFYTDASRLAAGGPNPLGLPTNWTTFFPGQDVKMTLATVPAMATVGVAWNGNPLTVELDLQWTQWSNAWSRSNAQFSTPTNLPVSPFLGSASGEAVVPSQEAFIFDWNDTWAARLGFAYKLNDRMELRWGVLYDQAPVPDSTRSPFLPDSDRWSVQVGMGYNREHWGLDWYVMYLQFQDASPSAGTYYNETGLPTLPAPVTSLYLNSYQALNDGTYKGTSVLAGVQFNYKF